jgi:hypothetical protein
LTLFLFFQESSRFSGESFTYIFAPSVTIFQPCVS